MKQKTTIEGPEYGQDEIGQNYIAFKDHEFTMTKLYYIKDGYCFMYVTAQKYKWLAMTIDLFNERYKKINDHLWIYSEDGKSYKIELLTDATDYFSVITTYQ